MPESMTEGRMTECRTARGKAGASGMGGGLLIDEGARRGELGKAVPRLGQDREALDGYSLPLDRDAAADAVGAHRERRLDVADVVAEPAMEHDAAVGGL